MRVLIDRDSLEARSTRLALLSHKLLNDEPLTYKEKVFVREDILWVQELFAKVKEQAGKPLTIRSF